MRDSERPQQCSDHGDGPGTINWISSFLNQRYQSVQFRGSSSNWLPVLSGVPQGSVLGPLLFNLFVLDLPNFVQSNLPQYADDTLLYRPIYSEDDVTIMQKDLDNIISWCILNKMCLNADKCKVMRLSKKLTCDGNTPSYKISNSSLSVVQNYKYLGVIIISSNLKWNDHVNHVASRTSRLPGFIKRIVRCNDPAILSRLYKTLCRPIIEYGAPAWLPYQQSHWHVHAFQHLGGSSLINSDWKNLAFHHLKTDFIT